MVEGVSLGVAPVTAVDGALETLGLAHASKKRAKGYSLGMK